MKKINLIKTIKLLCLAFVLNNQACSGKAADCLTSGAVGTVMSLVASEVYRKLSPEDQKALNREIVKRDQEIIEKKEKISEKDKITAQLVETNAKQAEIINQQAKEIAKLKEELDKRKTSCAVM